MIKNQKTCVICGREFPCSPSSKKCTCSPECRSERARRARIGYKLPEDVRSKISDKAKDRDLTALQKNGVEAAKRSPRSGRFQSNVNAKDWHLVSPEGKHYEFRSLQYWLRENGKELFGCDPDTKEFNAVRSGITNAKRATLGKSSSNSKPFPTYKGWSVVV